MVGLDTMGERKENCLQYANLVNLASNFVETMKKSHPGRALIFYPFEIEFEGEWKDINGRLGPG